MNQNGYYPQGAQGYPPQGQGYPSQGQGYPPPGQGYPPQGQGYSQPAAGGYTAPRVIGYNGPQAANAPVTEPGYPGPQNSGSYIPQTPYSPGYTSPGYQQPNGGSFIPQTPYSPGYTSPGYQPPQNGYQAPSGSYQSPMNGYPQPGRYTPGSTDGYSPYAQMGRIPPQGVDPNQFSNSIPLNGGGYVPQKIPVKKRPFAMKEWYLIAIGAVLVALFVAAVIITRNSLLKAILILLSAGSAGILWVKPMVAENRRLTFTILALALCVLTIVSFLLPRSGDATKRAAEDPKDTVQQSIGSGNNGVPEIPLSGSLQDTNNNTPEPEIKDTTLIERLITFFRLWYENRQDEMLALCAPSWRDKQENARASLFLLVGNRKPTEFTSESITGTDADTSRKVTLTVKIDRNDGKTPLKYRMTVLMVKESNEWFLDPLSLQSYENAETPDPNITPTPAPTPEPVVYSSTTLYYNPNKGEYYHADPNCPNVGDKYKPLQGVFTYGELNNEPYSKLKPCNVCAAPLRQ